MTQRHESVGVGPSDPMTESIVRRLHQIDRMLDGLRCDSSSMVPRPDHQAVVEIYKAESALMAAAKLMSEELHWYYSNGHGRL